MLLSALLSCRTSEQAGWSLASPMHGQSNAHTCISSYLCGLVFLLGYLEDCTALTDICFVWCLDGSWVSGEKILGSSERRRNVSTFILKHCLKFFPLLRNKYFFEGKLQCSISDLIVGPSYIYRYIRSVLLTAVCQLFWEGGGPEDFLRTCMPEFSAFLNLPVTLKFKWDIEPQFSFL